MSKYIEMRKQWVSDSVSWRDLYVMESANPDNGWTPIADVTDESIIAQLCRLRDYGDGYGIYVAEAKLVDLYNECVGQIDEFERDVLEAKIDEHEIPDMPDWCPTNVDWTGFRTA